MANFVNKIKRMGFFPQADENADFDNYEADYEDESYQEDYPTDYSNFDDNRSSSSR